MATIKSYTDISQSKKLGEILPFESADMEYILEQWMDEKTHRHKEEYCEIPVVKVDDDCPLQPITHPCWSLAALYNILPNNKKESTTLSRGGWKIEPPKYLDNWWCEYEDDGHSKDFTV